MKVFKQQRWTGGWFVGDFEPTAYKTDAFEVCHKVHPKDEKWPAHYHAVATEINFILKGKMSIIGQTLEAGDVFVIERNEVAEPVFLEDCELIVVKTPCVPNDKYIV